MVGKIQSSDIEITIRKLTEEDSGELSSFYCGDDTLDKFFHEEVLICAKYHYFSAYCAKERRTGEIVAVFTLANDAVVIHSDEDKSDLIETSASKIGNEYYPIFQKQTSFPAINIGHLGVRRDLQSKGIGQQIIDFVLQTFISYNITGCQFITVDSLNNPRTNKFYCRNGFEYQTLNDSNKDTRRMYLTIELYKDAEQNGEENIDDGT